MASTAIQSIEVLRQAQRFNYAVDVLSSCGNMDAGIPAEVNACIACELYLKYLRSFITEDTTVASEISKDGHELHTLYDELDDNVKKEIISTMELDEESFSEKLKKIQNNFCILRYEYEKDKIVSSFQFLKKLIYVLNDICEKIENKRLI